MTLDDQIRCSIDAVRRLPPQRPIEGSRYIAALYERLDDYDRDLLVETAHRLIKNARDRAEARRG